MEVCPTQEDIEDHARLDGGVIAAADEQAGLLELQAHAKPQILGQLLNEVLLPFVLQSHC